jgi:cytochrome c-type biogenesis protein CcmE
MEYTPAQMPPPAASGEFVSALGKHRKLLIAGVVLAVAFGYFGFTAFSSATAYYMPVDEAVALSNELTGQSFQVKGSLVPDSFQRQEGSITARFAVQENGIQLQATYDGVLPDLFFNEHSEIVLHGQFGPSGAFMVDRVLVKCPSKYESYDDLPDSYPTQ